MMPSIADAERAHLLLRESGDVPDGVLREPIARSWRRSLKAGVNFERPDEPLISSGSTLAENIERDHELLACAGPFVDSLYEEIKDSGSLVLLTDAVGSVLRATIDPGFSRLAQRAGAAPGSVWREECRGTNAMAIVITDRMPAEVLGPEHFLTSNASFACAAAPIFDASGQLRGVLDATTDFSGGKTHSLALVRLFAKTIENQLLQGSCAEGWLTIHFHMRPQFIGTPWEGIALVDPAGLVRSVNASGRNYLAPRKVDTDAVESVFGETLGVLADHARRRCSPLLKLQTPSGAFLYAKLESGQAPTARLVSSVTTPAQGTANSDRAPGALARLNTGDARFSMVLDKVRRVAGRDITVLIHGESGTGKELLARAIHHSGPRSHGPFVAVNCASIPDGLIESELFGYGDGAFTGARRRGSTGKVLQASGGTLFLDEIGDMPENVQSRLLRVLQEREVVPLGTNQAHKIDISVVSATHRDLKALIAQNRFRQDLYYRLNGLVVCIPALRDRTDLNELIVRICAEEAGRQGPPELSPEVREIFRNHPWPGNIRQLQAVLRTAIAMLDDETVIRTHHLAAEFLDEAGRTTQSAMSRSGDEARQGTDAPRTVSPAFRGTLRQMEARLTQEVVESNDGNISAAAAQLGISRTTLYRILRDTSS